MVGRFYFYFFLQAHAHAVWVVDWLVLVVVLTCGSVCNIKYTKCRRGDLELYVTHEAVS